VTTLTQQTADAWHIMDWAVHDEVRWQWMKEC